MEDGDWDTLAWDMVRQNCAFVVSFSVLLWDILITFGQEVQYVWHCPSRITKYHFLFCRYWPVGYIIAYLVSGTQWTPQILIQRTDCRTWFLIHVASVSLLYTGSQLTLIEKVFNLYGRSVILATALFVLQCIQVASMLILSHHISGSLHFNAICNGINAPNLTFSVLATAACFQSITWALILRKVWRLQTGFFPKWRRYLRTSEAHAKMSWGLAIVAITLNTTHSFAHQRVAPVYVFTFPMTVLSIGTCRYIIRVEKDRCKRETLTDITEIDGVDENIKSKSKREGKQRAIPSQWPATQDAYPPRPPTPMPVPSGSGPSPTQNFSPEIERHSLDARVSNFPYLRGAQSYLKSNRRSMATITTTTNDSPRSSSDCASRQAPSVRVSRSRSSVAGASVRSGPCVENTPNTETQSGDTPSASDIEIGSVHSSSSVDSEELRGFYNDTWNVGPFIAGGP